MQAIILAAGAGRRMGGIIPKPLIEIDDKPLLVRLIEQLIQAGINDIVIVTGHQKNLIEGAVSPFNVKTVFNPFYSISDNLTSFWTGRGFISETCIMAHGDLVLEDELLNRLIESEGDIVLPMDRSSLDDESMKMKITDGKLIFLSKSIHLDEATGESIPIMKFSPAALSELKRLTEMILERGQFGRFIDDAVFKLSQDDTFITSILDVTGLHWAEIDTQADLDNARKIFSDRK